MVLPSNFNTLESILFLGLFGFTAWFRPKLRFSLSLTETRFSSKRPLL
jgi:hypothetical protein